jgi:hypothetical protein
MVDCLLASTSCHTFSTKTRFNSVTFMAWQNQKTTILDLYKSFKYSLIPSKLIWHIKQVWKSRQSGEYWSDHCFHFSEPACTREWTSRAPMPRSCPHRSDKKTKLSNKHRLVMGEWEGGVIKPTPPFFSCFIFLKNLKMWYYWSHGFSWFWHPQVFLGGGIETRIWCWYRIRWKSASKKLTQKSYQRKSDRQMQWLFCTFFSGFKLGFRFCVYDTHIKFVTNTCTFLLTINPKSD